MAVSDDIRQELQEQLRQEILYAGVDNQHEILGRSDIQALLKCLNDDTCSDPIGLFWGLYEPCGTFEDRLMPGLSDQWDEQLVLNLLESLYHHYQVPYSPDDEPDHKDLRYSLDARDSEASAEHSIIPAKLRNLITFLHIAAIRAFKIKQSQGGELSEEVLNCLLEVERTMARLKHAGLFDLIDLDDCSQAFQLSAHAVSAKAFAELGRVRHREGRYDKALGYMAEAVEDSQYAIYRYAWDVGSASEGVPMAPLHNLDIYSSWPKGLDNLSPAEVVSTFRLLKEHGQPDSWSQVARDCKLVIECYQLFVDNQDVPEVEGITKWMDWVGDGVYSTTWGEFWHAALSWANAQLSPNEYRKMREEDEKSASERRLKNYFFGQDWSALPGRAKDRLITADLLWNSPENNAWEGLLNDLKLAAEDMCYEFIWRPLDGSSRGQELPDFSRLKNKLDGDENRPEIRHFIQICQKNYFKIFFEQQRLSKESIQFLIKDLPSALRELQSARNSGQHKSTNSWRKDEVRPSVRQFFGIGMKGVLPELARIGRKIQAG